VRKLNIQEKVHLSSRLKIVFKRKNLSQLKPELKIPVGVREVYILSTVVPLDLIILGKLPAIFSHNPFDGYHLISSIVAKEATSLEALIDTSLIHPLIIKNKPYYSSAKTVFLVNRIEVCDRIYSNVCIVIEPEGQKRVYYNSVDPSLSIPQPSCYKKVDKEEFIDIAISTVEQFLPSEKVSNDALQNQISDLFFHFQEFFKDDPWIDFLTAPNKLFTYLDNKICSMNPETMENYRVSFEFRRIFKFASEHGYLERKFPCKSDDGVVSAIPMIFLFNRVLGSTETFENFEEFIWMLRRKSRGLLHTLVNHKLQKREELVKWINVPNPKLQNSVLQIGFSSYMRQRYTEDVLDLLIDHIQMPVSQLNNDIRNVLFMFRNADVEMCKRLTKLLTKLLKKTHFDNQILQFVFSLGIDKSEIFIPYILQLKSEKKKISYTLAYAVIKKQNLKLLRLFALHDVLPDIKDFSPEASSEILKETPQITSPELFKILVSAGYIVPTAELVEVLIQNKRVDHLSCLIRSKFVSYHDARFQSFYDIKKQNNLFLVAEREDAVDLYKQLPYHPEKMGESILKAIEGGSSQILSFLLQQAHGKVFFSKKEQFAFFNGALSLRDPKRIRIIKILLLGMKVNIDGKILEKLKELAFEIDSYHLYFILTRLELGKAVSVIPDVFFIQSISRAIQSNSHRILTFLCNKFNKWKMAQPKGSSIENQMKNLEAVIFYEVFRKKDSLESLKIFLHKKLISPQRLFEASCRASQVDFIVLSISCGASIPEESEAFLKNLAYEADSAPLFEQLSKKGIIVDYKAHLKITDVSSDEYFKQGLEYFINRLKQSILDGKINLIKFLISDYLFGTWAKDVKLGTDSGRREEAIKRQDVLYELVNEKPELQKALLNTNLGSSKERKRQLVKEAIKGGYFQKLQYINLSEDFTEEWILQALELLPLNFQILKVLFSKCEKSFEQMDSFIFDKIQLNSSNTSESLATILLNITLQKKSLENLKYLLNRKIVSSQLLFEVICQDPVTAHIKLALSTGIAIPKDKEDFLKSLATEKDMFFLYRELQKRGIIGVRTAHHLRSENTLSEENFNSGLEYFMECLKESIFDGKDSLFALLILDFRSWKKMSLKSEQRIEEVNKRESELYKMVRGKPQLQKNLLKLEFACSEEEEKMLKEEAIQNDDVEMLQLIYSIAGDFIRENIVLALKINAKIEVVEYLLSIYRTRWDQMDKAMQDLFNRYFVYCTNVPKLRQILAISL
jgi:hypothetical protein